MKAARSQDNFGLPMCRYYFLRPSVFPPLYNQIGCRRVCAERPTFILCPERGFVNQKRGVFLFLCAGIPFAGAM